jgi:hypothetical protein
MKTVVVKTKDELKIALKGDASEIIVEDDNLIKQLRVIQRVRRAGPFVVGGIIASLALIPATGGISAAPTSIFVSALVAGASAETAGAGLSITGLCVAIGGVIAISLLTDWEEVSVPGAFKLKRKSKNSKKPKSS